MAGPAPRTLLPRRPDGPRGHPPHRRTRPRAAPARPGPGRPPVLPQRRRVEHRALARHGLPGRARAHRRLLGRPRPPGLARHPAKAPRRRGQPLVLGLRPGRPHRPDPRPWRGPADPGQWRETVESTLRARAGETGTTDDDREFAGFVAHLRDLVGKILRYEARFRADGLLPPDGTVRTVAAWDIGRASKMARWGRGARYATETEMRSAIESASAAARAAYGTWEEFSAGYILGRCLHFDEERFGTWYTTVLHAHRELTTDPDSPWRTVPFTGAA
ncbi:DUF1266 domain-containing protein [Streptomyces stramineus]